MAIDRLQWRRVDEDEVDRVSFTAACATGDYEIVRCTRTMLEGVACWFTRRADGVLIFLGTARTISEARASCEWDDGRGLSATVKARGLA